MLLQVYEVLSECTIATTYYSTMSWHYEEIKSCVDWFSPIKLRKPTMANHPTNPGRCNLLFRSDQSWKLRCRIGLLKYLLKPSRLKWLTCWPSFGGTRRDTNFFPWIGHSFLIVSLRASSCLSISSAGKTIRR